ncbi:MAG: peptidoglycan-associated outer rane lipoprotein, partial [Myxococcales bacterium]|nr:peptidoglycan-associated outer rane lipoprotein [Myxococcales bacterium]
MTRVVCTLSLLALVGGGCAHKQETKAEAPKQESAAAPQASSAPAPAASGAKMCATDLDCGAKQLCINNKCTDITADLAECTNVRVHFPFNSDEIDANDKSHLDRSARCLKADHSLHVAIEGNADERGTQEYNMALADRRARAVQSYLQSLGASQQQMATVSFGKENPECQEHDEACWAKNRRAALKA